MPDITFPVRWAILCLQRRRSARPNSRFSSRQWPSRRWARWSGVPVAPVAPVVGGPGGPVAWWSSPRIPGERCLTRALSAAIWDRMARGSIWWNGCACRAGYFGHQNHDYDDTVWTKPYEVATRTYQAHGPAILQNDLHRIHHRLRPDNQYLYG